MNSPDRGNDPLRKAKYIARRRPDYSCAWRLAQSWSIASNTPTRSHSASSVM